MRVVFDTSILIDALGGHLPALELMANATERSISIISWTEMLIGAKSPEELSEFFDFLNSFRRVEMDVELAMRTVRARQKYRLKLPDAIIYATALDLGAVLLTRNSKDFSRAMPQVHLPYQL